MKSRYKDRVSLSTTVTFSRGSFTGQGRVLDLTTPGCLIESPVTVGKGDYLRLKIVLPGLHSFLVVDLAAVRWTKEGRFGAEFIKMTEADRRLLDRFMSQSVRGRLDRFSEAGGHNWHLETHSKMRFKPQNGCF